MIKKLMKKQMKKVSVMVIIISMLLASLPLIQVKSLTGINELKITTPLTQWTLNEATNSLYAISEAGKCLLFINANTLAIDNNLPLVGSPTDIIQENGKLYIALDSINKIVIVDISTKTIVDTLNTTSDPYRIVKDGNSLYYTERDQWCYTYQYDLNNKTDKQLSIESLYNPDLAINVNNHILYIGESGSSGSDMIYYSTVENKVLGKTSYDNGLGFPYPNRDTLYDGQNVYYAGCKFNPLDPTNILANYGSNKIIQVKQGYVFAKTAIYDKVTNQIVNNYANGIDLYEISSQPMIYLYSAQEQKIVKVDPKKALITFNSVGGSVVPSFYSYKDALLTPPTAPTKTGYNFCGWYKDASYITPWNFATNKVTGDVALYAKWVKVVPTPTSMSAISSSYNSVQVSWGAVTGVSGYEIWRSTTSTGTYTQAGSTGITVSYNNTGLTNNTTYYFKVRAYTLVGTTKVYSAYSPIVSAKPVLASPTGIKSISTGYNSVNTSWVAVVGTSGYELWRGTSSAGTYSLVTTTTATNYTNTGLVNGATYYYKVRAYKLVGTTKIYSSFSTIVSAKPVLATPTGTKSISTGYNSLNTSWVAVTGTSGYELWRGTSSTGTYSLVTTTTATNYTNTGLVNGATYYYKVRAYKLVGTTKIYSSFSTIVSAKPVLATPTGTKSISTGYNSLNTSWVAVTGASGYELWRGTSSTGTYSLVTTTTATNYTNTGLVNGATYYYKVRAYKLVGTTKIYSSFSTIVNAKPVLATPAGTKSISTGYNSLNTSWVAVTGTSGYELWRGTSSTGTYSLVTTTTATNYTNTGLATATTYYYKVRAYKLVGTTKIYSGFSTIVSAKPVPSVPSNLSLQQTSNSDLLISWSAVSGASGYAIYRATGVNGTYSEIKNTTNLNYTARAVDLQLGQYYYFFIKSYRYVGTQKIYSGSSRIVYVKFYLQ